MTASSRDTPLVARRHYERGYAACRSGDTLAVTKLDRPAGLCPTPVTVSRPGHLCLINISF